MTAMKLMGAVKNLPYQLQLVVKDDNVAVDMTSQRVEVTLDTYNTPLVKDETSVDVTRGSDGMVTVAYTADEMNQRPGTYDMAVVFKDLVESSSVIVNASFKIEGVA